jgi:hypothetical protein
MMATFIAEGFLADWVSAQKFGSPAGAPPQLRRWRQKTGRNRRGRAAARFLALFDATHNNEVAAPQRRRRRAADANGHLA